MLKSFLGTNIDDLGISSSTFLSRTIVKLHNIHVTLKLIKQVITDPDSLKASGPDYILVVEKCEPELSYMLTDLFLCV